MFLSVCVSVFTVYVHVRVWILWHGFWGEYRAVIFFYTAIRVQPACASVKNQICLNCLNIKSIFLCKIKRWEWETGRIFFPSRIMCWPTVNFLAYISKAINSRDIWHWKHTCKSGPCGFLLLMLFCFSVDL